MSIGGGGGGGPIGVSNTFTGPAEALDLVGNHIMGYTGLSQFDDNEATILQFTTGNYYSVLRIMPTRSDTLSADSHVTLSLNGTEVYVMGSEDAKRIGQGITNELVVPAYTEIKITQQNINTSDTLTGGVAISGRIYRTRD